MGTKTFTRVEIKDEDRGEVTAVFATLNVIDSDGDVTVKGAFEDGAKVRISAYGHSSWNGTLPVGKGSIREEGDEAILAGRFFLNTPAGADTFKVVKELGADGLQEWSYGYDAIEYSFGEFEEQQVRYLNKLKVHEVSPVLLGAGVGTRLLTAKSGPMKFDEHAESVLAEIRGLIERFPEVITFRTAQGKSRMSEHSVELLNRVEAELKRLLALREPEPDDTSADDVAREFARYVSLSMQGAP